jgi:iron(II)-dependent oxidoreductase
MATIASRDPIAPPHSLQDDPEEALAALDTVREQTLALIGHLSEEQLSEVLSPIMSPLAWDLAHIAAYEDLWLAHRHGGLELLRPDLAEMYDAFETPRSVRGEIELLSPAQARAYLKDVRERSTEALARRGVGDGTIYELVMRHELQHSETMRQTMALAGLLPADEPPRGPRGTGGWLEIGAGPFELGADSAWFAYDNERPRHTVDVAAFEIARSPVSNATWMSFAEDGGYERREWWSPEGWSWKQENDIAPDSGMASGDPDAPACHVSWFEADAFARASEARLPSEAEWEKAGEYSMSAHPSRDGAKPQSGKPYGTSGVLEGVGYVWEWTSTRFDGYPGFVAHPYREYSEVFFGGDYRVLRGSSWATSPRVRTATFRNWDHPFRRQIFAGVRLARDTTR